MVELLVKERKFDKVKHQFLAIMCANLITLSHGCILGWLSPYLPLLQSDASPLESGPVTLAETSWIGSIICIGGVSGNFIFGMLVNYLGCKRTISCLAFPQIGFWACVIYGKYVYHLYAARVFAGLTGGGVFICIPLFVAEIADDSVRGTLGSLLLVNYNMGILISFIAGSYVEYDTLPYIMVALPIIFFCVFAFLPDTPQYLLRMAKVQEAEKSMRFYRNCADGSKVQCTSFADDFQRLKNVATTNELQGNSFQWSNLCAPSARCGILIGVCLMAINQFSGCFALINYTASIFRDSGSNIDPYVSSIILASVQIAGTYISTILVDRSGRRVLLLVSASSTACGLTVMGLYSFLGSYLMWDLSAFSWVPVTSLSFVIFIASIGILPLPFVVLAEILPENVRAVGSTICVTSISIMSFLILKTFPILASIIGLYGCMWIFAGICFMGTVFIALFVEETKGKSLDAMVRSRGMSIF